MIEGLQDWLMLHPARHLCVAGGLIGLAVGIVLQRTNFCVMGGLSDATLFRDTRRLRAWLLAIAVALVGAHALEAWDITNLGRSRYLGGQINWLGHALGGFVFGIGMVLAGGCASRNLARAGAGDLRSLMVIVVLATFAYSALSGVFATTRVTLQTATAIEMEPHGLPGQRLSDMIGAASSAPEGTLRLTLACLTALALAATAFANADFRRAPRHIFAGVSLGVLVTAAWALTGLALDDLADRPVTTEAVSFVAPVGRALDWFERATAIGYPSFGASIVIGTLIGSFLSAWITKTLHWQTFHDVADTVRHLGGAALMGVGGVFAMGCTIGQGISGLSTLSIGSIISIAGIITGALVMLNTLARD